MVVGPRERELACLRAERSCSGKLLRFAEYGVLLWSGSKPEVPASQTRIAGILPLWGAPVGPVWVAGSPCPPLFTLVAPYVALFVSVPTLARPPL